MVIYQAWIGFDNDDRWDDKYFLSMEKAQEWLAREEAKYENDEQGMDYRLYTIEVEE